MEAPLDFKTLGTTDDFCYGPHRYVIRIYQNCRFVHIWFALLLRDLSHHIEGPFSVSPMSHVPSPMLVPSKVSRREPQYWASRVAPVGKLHSHFLL